MDKKSKIVDRRVMRTKRAIRNAFAKLMTEKDINDITIIELAEAADINRKTFYNYYSGVYQVVEEIEHDIANRYDQLLGDVEFRRDMDTPYVLFERFSALIDMDPEFFAYLLTMDGNRSLITRIMHLIKNKTRDAMVEQLDIESDKAGIMLEFVLAGMMSVYQRWFASDKHIPLEEVSKLISVMSFQGINGIINNV